MSNIVEFTRPTGSAQKAVILVRVSSREQEEGYSLDAQRHRLIRYCDSRNLDVISTFEIVESSTKGDRRRFMELIKFASGQKETIAIVADKVDRIQRSFKEYPLLDDLIQRGKIELHFNSENYIIHKNSVSQERMMWSMGVIMAQSYVDSMRDNIRRSYDHKIRIGEYISKAPIGYLNTRDDKGRAQIVLDEDRAHLVRRIFTEFAQGGMTLSEITEKAAAWGLKTSTRKKSAIVKSHMHKLIQNPFYYGCMRIKGKIYQHSYTPIISKEIFDSCQDVLKGWHKKPFKHGQKEFTFRGLLKCGFTGRTVSASVQKKKYDNGGTGEWTYLVTWHPADHAKKMWVREETVIEQVERILQRLTIPTDILHDVIDYVRNTDQVERDYVRRQLVELQKAYSLAQCRIDGLMDLLLDKVIDREDYENKRLALREEQNRIEQQMQAHREGDDSFKDSMVGLLDACSNSGQLFKGSKPEAQRQLLNFLFSNLELKGATLCYSLRKPFDEFEKCSNLKEWSTLVDRLRTSPALRQAIVSFQPIKIAA